MTWLYITKTQHCTSVMYFLHNVKNGIEKNTDFKIMKCSCLKSRQYGRNVLTVTMSNMLWGNKYINPFMKATASAMNLHSTKSCYNTRREEMSLLLICIPLFEKLQNTVQTAISLGASNQTLQNIFNCHSQDYVRELSIRAVIQFAIVYIVL